MNWKKKRKEKKNSNYLLIYSIFLICLDIYIHLLTLVDPTSVSSYDKPASPLLVPWDHSSCDNWQVLQLHCWCCTLKWQLKQFLVEFYPEVAWEKYSQIHTKLISPVWYWEWLKEMALACKTSTFHKNNASETEHQRKKALLH